MSTLRARAAVFRIRAPPRSLQVCGLVYERNPGDTWAFTIICDRLPVGVGIVLLYFGFGRAHKLLGIAAFIVMAALLLVTSPNRWGAGIALHYLSRVYWPDPADPVPAILASDSSSNHHV